MKDGFTLYVTETARNNFLLLRGLIVDDNGSKCTVDLTSESMGYLRMK